MGNRSTGQPWTPFPPGIEQAFAVQWSSSVVRTNGALELDNRIASPARLPTLLDCGDPSCNRVLKFFIGTNISINHCVSHGSASWPPPLAPPHLKRPMTTPRRLSRPLRAIRRSPLMLIGFGVCPYCGTQNHVFCTIESTTPWDADEHLRPCPYVIRWVCFKCERQFNSEVWLQRPDPPKSHLAIRVPRAKCRDASSPLNLSQVAQRSR
jgi:hypothetical protein